MSKIKAFIKNPSYFITSPASKGYLDWMPDEMYLKLLYRLKLGYACNLKNPKLFNEKLQWLKLNDRKPEYAQMVDKWEVRSYIEEVCGAQYLIPSYGVFNSTEEIDFNELPNRFVIKCTHDSGSVEVCTDKTTWDKESAVSRINEALKRNYYKTYREWPYKDVKPRIIIEKYIHDKSSDDLKDYKVMCFNGKAKVIELHENRFSSDRIHTQTFYSNTWEKLDILQPFADATIETAPKPAVLDIMLNLSERISADMYHARIDWYEVDGYLFFGEITFYDGSGFESFTKIEYDRYLGDLIDIGGDAIKGY